MSFLQRCIWPQGSDENLHLAGGQGAKICFNSWLLMSPIEFFPGREHGTVIFSRRHWKRQFFELSLVRGQTTQDTDRFHLTCYSKSDRKRPKGCIDMNTVTDLRKMSVPPDELLATLSRKHRCDDCQLMDADPSRQVVTYDRLPFFSFEAMFGEHRGRVYLLAEDPRQMQHWVSYLSSACDMPDAKVGQSVDMPQPVSPVAPVSPFLSINRPWHDKVNPHTGSSGRHHNSPTGRKNVDDEPYGELPRETGGEGVYDDPRHAAGLTEKLMTPTASVASESVDSGTFDMPPSIALRQFVSQSSGKGAARQSSTDYENLIQIGATVATAYMPNQVYGCVSSDMHK
ncbi:hypothetical protein BOX15_Mlig030690g1 [Macrostomum lignano]|uniref:PH domain-containing protein n=1 Tax=Macrostomum lignano TaxID=282301 RepID=A0A267EG69_9PLAT|nr:hypothetical protein BOX15_Mlig030690g1 [Macrostomum lignano]